MSGHEKFNFNNLDALEHKIAELNANIQISHNLDVFREAVKVGTKTAPNSFAVLPMEGCDCEEDGAPSELTARRYHRFASGGAGLLWWEACSVVPEGRANPLQMMLTRQNIKSFSKLIADCSLAAKQAGGSDHRPINILQLTHSGRYSRPYGHKLSPLVPQRDPILDERSNVLSDDCIVTDDYLDSLVEKYAEAAVLAQQAGFDGVDIKACHRYLISELLASYTREGKYGGSFENRTRFLLQIIEEVRKVTGNDFIIACRFNIYDAHPYPYGFGANKENMWIFDKDEPVRLVDLLCKAGVDLLSNTAGNPYYIYPQVTRPFNTSSLGIPVPDEHPLTSISRLFEFTHLVQQTAKHIPVVGNGYSWLRQFIPYVGAANLESGSCRFVGMGRNSFAYPDAPNDLFNKGGFVSEKCCIACSKCTQIMRDHGSTGCVIKDSSIYAPLYMKARNKAAEREKK